MSARGHAHLLAASTLSVSALPSLSGTQPLPSDASREHISINNGTFLPLYLHAGSQTSKHPSVCIYIWASDHQARTVEWSYCAGLLACYLCVKNKQNADELNENNYKKKKTQTKRASRYISLSRSSIKKQTNKKKNESSYSLGLRACFVQVQWHSQLPLVDGDRRVSVSPARQLHVLAVQVPVSIKALNLHIGFICKNATRNSAQTYTKSSLPKATWLTNKCKNLWNYLYLKHTIYVDFCV